MESAVLHSRYTSITCKRCRLLFNLDLNRDPAIRRQESKFKDVCTDCLNGTELQEAIKIMHGEID